VNQNATPFLVDTAQVQAQSMLIYTFSTIHFINLHLQAQSLQVFPSRKDNRVASEPNRAVFSESHSSDLCLGSCDVCLTRLVCHF